MKRKYIGAIFVTILVFSGVVFGEQRNTDDELEQEAQLGGSEQSAWAQQEFGNLRAIESRIQRRLEKAREDHDILMITCLQNRKTQLEANIRAFSERMAQHQEAIRNQNEEYRDHHYRLLVILSQRSRVAQSEANSCVGVDDVHPGRTTRTTEVDPSVTDDETTDYPEPEFSLYRPPSASGYY